MNRAKWICEWYKVSSDSVSELGGGMTRRCSLCSNNGHNSRTCPSRSVKLFGVRMSLTDGSFIKKSASMSNLSSSSTTATAASPSSDGYSSDHPSLPSSSRQKKKGVPWTEEEHRMFLIGLQKLGKGDWRGIASNFVVSRTPTQVASHAQKYFIRQSNATRRKRRSSLFDLPPDMVSNPPSMPEVLLPPSENSQPTNAESQPSLNLSLKSEFEPMETTQENVEEPNETMMASNGMTPVPPGFFSTYLPLPFSMWPSNAASCEGVNGAETSYHQVLKPIPVIPKEPVNVDEFVGISQLSIGETGETRVRDKEPSPLSLKLLGEPSRQSAFHAKTPVGDSDLNNGKNNVIQAG